MPEYRTRQDLGVVLCRDADGRYWFQPLIWFERKGEERKLWSWWTPVPSYMKPEEQWGKGEVADPPEIG